MAKTKSANLKTARLYLAREAYTTTFLAKLSFADAELAFKKIMGDLNAEPDEVLEMDAIQHMTKLYEAQKDALLRVRRQETKELLMVHKAVLKHVLKDADAGIPDEITADTVKELDGEELTTAINSLIKVQDQRRKLLVS